MECPFFCALCRAALHMTLCHWTHPAPQFHRADPAHHEAKLLIAMSAMSATDPPPGRSTMSALLRRWLSREAGREYTNPYMKREAKLLPCPFRWWAGLVKSLVTLAIIQFYSKSLAHCIMAYTYRRGWRAFSACQSVRSPPSAFIQKLLGRPFRPVDHVANRRTTDVAYVGVRAGTLFCHCFEPLRVGRRKQLSAFEHAGPPCGGAWRPGWASFWLASA